MTTTPTENNITQEEEKEAKIRELREIITNAQETISSATQLLSAIQGVSPTEMPINSSDAKEEDDSQSIYGYFDGQIMIGDDGKQYPVPANYASKSKLVEGDKLKLNITPDNRFVYKQIGPVQRNYLIGLVKKDSKGNFTIQTPEKEYQVLLAAATYFKIEDGDEVTLIVPQGKTTVWGAIENVLQKNTTASHNINSSLESALINDTSDDIPEITLPDENTFDKDKTRPENIDNNITSTNNTKELSAIEKLEIEIEKEKLVQKDTLDTSSSENKTNNEWSSDIEKLKQEASIAAS